jgi:hypothetical protein
MLRNRSVPPVRMQHALAVCVSLALAACSSKYSQLPARLDLSQYGRVAIVTFAADQDHDGMSTLATQRFAETLLANQTGIELLELGAADSTVRALPASADGMALAQALGRQKGVPAVFVGTLKVSKVKPRGHLDASGVNLRAGVSAELTVRLLSTSTGGTVWRSSSVANGSIGRLNLSGGLPSIAVRDKEEAFGEVVRQLIVDVTRDLRPTWVKQ